MLTLGTLRMENSEFELDFAEGVEDRIFGVWRMEFCAMRMPANMARASARSILPFIHGAQNVCDRELDHLLGFKRREQVGGIAGEDGGVVETAVVVAEVPSAHSGGAAAKTAVLDVFALRGGEVVVHESSFQK
jgi:hypothetical protein